MHSIVLGFVLSAIIWLWLASNVNEGHEHIVWFLYFLAVAVPFLLAMDNGSIRVVVMDSKLIFRQGFCFMRRTIYYNEIFDIAFKNSAKYADLNRYYGRKRFYIGRADPEIIINLRDGDHFIVGGSKYTEEILSAIKLARPHINID